MLFPQLVWVLVGPEYCNLLANLGKPGAGKPFSHFPWVNTPDGIILAYLQTARATTQLPQNQASLPLKNVHIGSLYAHASQEDLDKLHKVM